MKHKPINPIIAFLFFFIIIIPIMYYSRDSEDEIDQDGESINKNINDNEIKQHLEITATSLYSEYKESEDSADNIYKGNVIDVSGVSWGIKKDAHNETYLSFKGKNKYLDIHAFLQQKEIEKAANIKKGTAITVTCEGDGMIAGTVILKNCTTN